MTWIEAIRERWANLQPGIRLLLLVLILAGLGISLGRPGYAALKSWRLKENLRDAKTAVEEDRMNEARDLSLTVLRSGDPSIEAYRVLEKSMAALRDPRHSEVARALLSHPGSSKADQLNGFRGIAPEAPLGLLGQAWASLPADFQIDPDFAIIFADRLIAAGRLHEAAPVLLAIPDERRTYAIHQRFAHILILRGRSQDHDEAQQIIAMHWQSDAGPQTEWLNLLEEIPVANLDPTLLQPVRDTLLRAENALNPRDNLMLVRLSYAENFSDRQAILSQALAWKTRAPAELARFLSQLGLLDLLLETFPPDSIATHPELLVPVLDSLVESQQWPKVGKVLELHGEQLPNSVLLRHKALVAAKTAASGAAAEPWNAAMGDAKFSTAADAYLSLYQFAVKHGMLPEAEQALTEAILSGRGPLPLYADLRPLLISLAAKGQENILMQICAIYLLFEPGNPVLITQYAYLACLNGLAEPATVLEAAVPLAKAFPDSLPIQCMLATAYLSANQPAAALKTLEPFHTDLEKLTPSYRAVFLVTYLRNGKIAKDDPRITQLPWKDMLPSERKTFNEWLKQDIQTSVTDATEISPTAPSH